MEEHLNMQVLFSMLIEKLHIQTLYTDDQHILAHSLTELQYTIVSSKTSNG